MLLDTEAGETVEFPDHWTPRSNEDCIAETTESLRRLGLLKA
jgi:hypothetical protein